MGDQSDEMVITRNPDPAPAAANGVFVIWLAFAILAVIMAAGAVLVRLMAGPRFDGLLILAACGSAVLLALRIPRSRTMAPGSSPYDRLLPENDALNNILHSAGPAVVAIGLDGRLTFANPAAERMIGCDEAELKSMFGIVEILAPGESCPARGGDAKADGRQAEPCRDAERPDVCLPRYCAHASAKPDSVLRCAVTPQGWDIGSGDAAHVGHARRSRRGHGACGCRGRSSRDVASGAGSARIAGDDIAICLRTPAR